ncbi:hypothetical protein L198_06240 [Cryptococcus wingfieldii CBS 7118]|uniref:SWI5-dependent HO expression protein 3 n=1 Tax=Cryptococcus wingfieldii CBS 7118 TaxID=1295528 RepID=A0A1E3INQ8_9TREE|nr:hypothetical protein L198_06240 [Cryptococcus wingfieldii CBS 7118]ODN90222.1 hypothetical protein L198_06240 [Cryptococcus wingfieldii CBS 7118]
MSADTPSKIPVIRPLPHSRSTSSLGPHPQSPTSPLGGAMGRASPAPGTPILGVGGRRLSLVNGFGTGQGAGAGRGAHIRTRQGSKAGSISEVLEDDPAHLKAQIQSLRADLDSTKLRLLQAEASRATSPTLPDVSVGTPLTVSLIEEEKRGDRNSPLDHEPPTRKSSESGSRPSSRPSSRGLPHSNGSYDLKVHADTPKDGRSRIPQAVVSHATALHPTPPISNSSRRNVSSPSPGPHSPLSDRYTTRSPYLAVDSPSPNPFPFSPLAHSTSSGLGRAFSPSPSPSSRKTSGSASTKVIDSLQTELLNTKTHLERVKSEVRAGQRRVEQLTRQKEDLQETKERMRVENEGLNNVIARKERLLQEVLERARTAESAFKEISSTRKTLEQSTKKSLTDMTAQLQEAKMREMKAEREAQSLKDGVQSLKDLWARDVKGVREEMKRAEEAEREKREEDARKREEVLKLVETQATERAETENVARDALSKCAQLTEHFEERFSGLRAEAEKNGKECQKANARAK